MIRKRPPVVDWTDIEGDDVPGTDFTTEGILLAAGEGTRFADGNKLLARLKGQPLITHAVESLIAAHLTGVTVVTGHEAAQVAPVLREYPVRVVENAAYAEGQATSVRTGLAAVRGSAGEEPDAVMFALADMPCVDSTTIDRLVTAYSAGVGSPIAAAYDGRRGNPVLFGKEHFDALEGVSGDTGGREVFRRSETAALVETDDPGVLVDVDTRDDLRQLRD